MGFFLVIPFDYFQGIIQAAFPSTRTFTLGNGNASNHTKGNLSPACVSDKIPSADRGVFEVMTPLYTLHTCATGPNMSNAHPACFITIPVYACFVLFFVFVLFCLFVFVWLVLFCFVLSCPRLKQYAVWHRNDDRNLSKDSTSVLRSKDEIVTYNVQNHPTCTCAAQ